MSWKLMLPPQILAGQVNPVVLSAPTVVCQQLAGRFKAVAPSKPELNRSFAEPGAGAGGATVTGGITGAGAGAGAGGATVTGGTTGAGEIGEHTSELQSHHDLVCRLLLEKK